MGRVNDHAREVRNALTSPADLCVKLGLFDGSKRQARGLLIRCPAHGERDPSCSVTLGPDGTIRVRCFACDFSGDALTLIAHKFGLSLSTDFREVLATGADLAGQRMLADEIRDGAQRPERKPVPAPAPVPEAEYPPADEVLAVWQASGSVADDPEASGLLVSRRIDPDMIASMDLARVIPHGAMLPRWAAYQGRSWVETGHTLIIRSWDVYGAARSLRAWCVRGGSAPKRLPPAGCKAAELVQANLAGWRMLKRTASPLRLVIAEGEPDWLVAATQLAPSDAVIGIGSGSWIDGFARRVPTGTEVIVATHADDAGDRYAAKVLESLGDRCPAYRWRMAA